MRRIPTISQTTVSQRESFSTDRFPTTDSQYDSFSNDIFSTRQFLKQTISQHDIFSTDIIATRHILKRHFPKRQFLNFYWFHDIFPIPLNKTTVSQIILRKRLFLNFNWFHDSFPISFYKTTVSQFLGALKPVRTKFGAGVDKTWTPSYGPP